MTNETKKTEAIDEVEVKNAANIIRALFESNSLYRCNSIEVPKIAEVVRLIANWNFDDAVIRNALTRLVRESVLRSRVTSARRVYEANLSSEDFAK